MKTVALGKVAKIDRTVANDNECLSLPYVGLVQLPPLSLQEEFAGVVARVESLRRWMGESARQVEGCLSPF
jgi:hypothetical protein